jgi:Tol biopolymer transport system component
VVEALDLGTTDTWVPINLTPRRITCHEYDDFDYQLFVKDLATGTVRQLTSTTRRGDWNADWSPDAKRVAHDVVLADASGIYGLRGYLGITSVADGRTRLLKGSLGGNDADWNPGGKWLAFDRATANDRSIYSLPASGGTRRLIRRDAVSADIAPSGKRILYLEPSSSRIMTVDLKGLHPVVVTRLRSRVGPRAQWYETNPSWSPNGRWIAYADGGHIWKVRVGSSGSPLARPVRLTAGQAVARNPTWSHDGAWVYYQARYADESRIWRIPASGGIPVAVTAGPGLNGFGDVNGVESPTGDSVVFSSVAPVTPS